MIVFTTIFTNQTNYFKFFILTEKGPYYNTVAPDPVLKRIIKKE